MEDDEAVGKNCCNIPYTKCSIAISAIFFIVFLTIFVLAFVFPEPICDIYQVTKSPRVTTICASVVSALIIAANCLLVYGIVKNWAVFLLVWVVIVAIIWQLHFILFLCCLAVVSMHHDIKSHIGPLIIMFVANGTNIFEFSQYKSIQRQIFHTTTHKTRHFRYLVRRLLHRWQRQSYTSERKSTENESNASIFVLAIWLALIVLVGQHWYYICEQLYHQEHGDTGRLGGSGRYRTISNISRNISLYSRNRTAASRIH